MYYSKKLCVHIKKSFSLFFGIYDDAFCLCNIGNVA